MKGNGIKERSPLVFPSSRQKFWSKQRPSDVEQVTLRATAVTFLVSSELLVLVLVYVRASDGRGWLLSADGTPAGLQG